MILSRVAEVDGGVALSAALSLAAAKVHLRVTHDADDADITSLCSVARAHLEGADGTGGRLGAAITRHVLQGDAEGFPDGRDLYLPQPPLVSVAWIKYYDADNVQQTLSSALYHVVRHPVQPSVRLASTAAWPAVYDRPDAVSVRYTCGPATVPEDLLHALKLHVGHLWINREVALEKTLVQMPLGYEALIGPHRTHGWL